MCYAVYICIYIYIYIAIVSPKNDLWHQASCSRNCHEGVKPNYAHVCRTLWWLSSGGFTHIPNGHVTGGGTIILGEFDWGVWYVIIFLCELFWIRLATVSKRGKKVRTVAFPAVRSVNESRDILNYVQKQARVCNLCHLYHSFISESPRISFVLSDIANTPQFQSSWRWPLWCYRSPQDVSTGHGRCHGDNPWKFRNDVIV